MDSEHGTEHTLSLYSEHGNRLSNYGNPQGCCNVLELFQLASIKGLRVQNSALPYPSIAPPKNRSYRSTQDKRQRPHGTSVTLEPCGRCSLSRIDGCPKVLFLVKTFLMATRLRSAVFFFGRRGGTSVRNRAGCSQCCGNGEIHRSVWRVPF